MGDRCPKKALQYFTFLTFSLMAPYIRFTTSACLKSSFYTIFFYTIKNTFILTFNKKLFKYIQGTPESKLLGQQLKAFTPQSGAQHLGGLILTPKKVMLTLNRLKVWVAFHENQQISPAT